MSVLYRCSECGSTNVQLNFPCWVNANDIDDGSKYELDYEASPEEDSDKCWCKDCEEHCLLDRVEFDASSDFDDLMKIVLAILPKASLGEDNDGQVVIYTNLKALKGGALGDMG